MTNTSNEDFQANGAPLYDIFLSYSTWDGGAVTKVQQFLERPRVVENKEIALRVFRDHTDLRGGELTTEIAYAIGKSTYFVLCCSEKSAASRWVQMELERFMQARDLSRVIVLVLDGPIPAILPTQLAKRDLKALDLRDGWFLGWPRSQTRDELLRAIAKVSNANLRSLIDWERRDRIKRRIQLSALLATFVALLAFAAVVTIQFSPSSDWTRTDLDSFARPVEHVQIVEQARSTPLLRTYSFWTQQSVRQRPADC
jgi:hypothetical protein